MCSKIQLMILNLKILLKKNNLSILKNSRDFEGEYNENFVKKVIKISQEKPKHIYNSKSFLKMLS